ncbi:MAG: HEPN domain-containing protein [Bryobacteraceae bacterium]
MTPAELLLDETRQWLRRAHEDLQVAALTIAGGIERIAVFHCQQAAEKAMNAFLTWHQKTFGKTHNLQILREDCERLDHSLSEVLKPADALTDYAVQFRYPGASHDPDSEEATAALGIAQKAYDEILRRLPAEVMPPLDREE